MLREDGSTIARERVRSIVVIEITDAAALISPAYDDAASEDAIKGLWIERYNAKHRKLPASHDERVHHRRSSAPVADRW